MKSMKIDSNYDEVAQAEQEARENREKFEETLKSFGTKVEDLSKNVNERTDHFKARITDRVHTLQEALESGANRLDETINFGRKELDTRLGKFDSAISSVGSEFDVSFDRIKETAGRLKMGAHSILDDVDQVGVKIENVFLAIRRDLERIVGNFRSSLSQGTGQLRQILDRAETSVNQAADPARLVSSNPRVAIASLLFGGMVLGLFMKKNFTSSKNVSIGKVPEAKPVKSVQPHKRDSRAA